MEAENDWTGLAAGSGMDVGGELGRRDPEDEGVEMLIFF
jgi:hypothetical protein